MSELTEKSCQPLDKSTPPLSIDEVNNLLGQIHPDWRYQPETTEILRDFKFKNYYQTIAFVNALAWIAHQDDHHPELEVSYNHCVVHYSTHSIGGISENDFICAAKIDALVSSSK